MKLTRALDPVEIRVLGALLEKQQATPDYYPMTVNSLVAACNQKSNRDPVMSVGDGDVQTALERLQQNVLVWKVLGGRVVHWKHNLDGPWQLSAREKALLTELFLRGPQTSGELRSRAERLRRFDSRDEIEECLKRMAEDAEPLILELPRQHGQKERRWTHLVGGAPAVADIREAPIPAPERSLDFISRVERLESEVAAIRAELRELKGEPEEG